MPRNIEIKALVKMDFEKFLKLAEKVSGSSGKILKQVDTFYNCSNGRLKLRSVCSQNEQKSELIFYKRCDKEGPKLSTFQITPVVCHSSMDLLLAQSLGRKGEVRKMRRVFISDQTRIHADQVEGLGNFMELEVMLDENQDAGDGEIIAMKLMDLLQVDKSDLITGAYFDLISKSTDKNEELIS